MVRLKELELHVLVRVAEFQFHMVRLKDRGGALPAPVDGFQFHMVRLKGVYRRLRTAGKQYFNSTWYD